MPLFFLQRNEVLAALTSATVVVQAGFSSGARSTAAAARRLGRPLCVVPHPPWDPRGQGCAHELAHGAQAVYGPEDVLAALGRPPPPPVRPRRGRRSLGAGAGGDRGAVSVAEQATLPLVEVGALEPAEAAMLAAAGEEPRHFDELCERAGLAVSQATGALLSLTLRAVVVEGPAGFFRRVGLPRS
jgi:DNA processing protein